MALAKERRLAYATRAVPRYTSYPTAPHFGAAVDGETYRAWLAALPAETGLSLYLHIPYCRSICAYCGCHTKAALRDDPVIAYADDLAREIALVAGALGGRRKVTHIHWGGGTPSLLPRTSFEGVVAVIEACFDLADLVEHAIELDPRTVTPEMAAMLAKAGITRASLGVQDFDAKVQEAIRRVQPLETVTNATRFLREAGIAAINYDLMYGLPYQTIETIEDTVATAATLDPSRLALFGYAHVPWFKKHQRLIDEAALPGASERIALEEAARAALARHGYRAIGLDHFAKPDDAMAVAAERGDLKRNFQGYTTDDAPALIGLGASAIGKLPQGYVQNDPDIAGWRRAVEAGRLPVVKGKALEGEDALRADVIMTLMCDYGADVGAIAARHGAAVDALGDGFARLDDLVRDGLVEIDGTRIRVTEEGRPFVRLAAAAFDSYLAQAAARHSVAV